MDDGDGRSVQSLATTWQLDEADVIVFEFHGKLHYSWSTCLLEPRYSARETAYLGEHAETPLQQIERMLSCIQLAHVFLGSCEAMTKLFIGEMQDQAGGYIVGSVGGRSPADLNRLRTLAVAVGSLTSFSLVTPTSEDQDYFAKFEHDAGIPAQHQMITDACDVLYSVQSAHQQSVEAYRSFVLGNVVLVLTALSLVSVLISSYDFVRANAELLRPIWVRLGVLVGSVLLLVLVVIAIVRYNRPGDRPSKLR